VKLVEPPSCSAASAIVFIGRNRRGQWVAQEQNGLYGGLFVNRAQAVKYALFEIGRHPETIIELARDIELDMGRAAASRARRPPDASPDRANRRPQRQQEFGVPFQIADPHDLSFNSRYLAGGLHSRYSDAVR
jgi:hypothetical protein